MSTYCYECDKCGTQIAIESKAITSCPFCDRDQIRADLTGLLTALTGQDQKLKERDSTSSLMVRVAVEIDRLRDELAKRVGVIDKFITDCGFNVNDGFEINSRKISALRAELEQLKKQKPNGGWRCNLGNDEWDHDWIEKSDSAGGEGGGPVEQWSWRECRVCGVVEDEVANLRAELEQSKRREAALMKAVAYHKQLSKSWLALGSDSETLRRIYNSALNCDKQLGP